MADESLEGSPTLDFSKFKVPDLKKELKNRGLSTSGNKNELIERLQASIKSTGSADSIDDIEEVLLNEDDDDEHLDERDSIINELDHDLDESPKTQKRKISEGDKSEASTGPPKKVILKRNNSDSTTPKNATSAADKPKEEKKNEEISFNDEAKEKKVIKLSELSVKERLEMRAKKFGVTAFSDDAKKLARAERFNAKANNSAISMKLDDKDTKIEVLKQRAARFGVSVSTIMSDLEKQEKLEKRKQRFGVVTTPNNDKPAATLDAAKAARLERFKTVVK